MTPSAVRNLSYSVGLCVIAFFSFSGYYAGLGFFIDLFGSAASRLYSVPVRVFISLLSLFFFIRMSPIVLREVKGGALGAFIGVFFFLLLYVFNLAANFSLEEYSRPASESIFYVAVFCVFPLLFFSTLRSGSDLDRVANTIIFSGFMLGVTSFFLYQAEISGGVTRISVLARSDDDATYLSPLALSYCGSLTVVVSVMKVSSMSTGFYSKLFCFVSAIAGLYCFMLGASRGSVIALGASLLALMYVNRRRFKASILFYLLGLCFLLPLLLGVTGSGVFDRFFGIRSDIEAGATSSARLEIWRLAFQSIIESPLIGGRIEILGNYPHNFLIEAIMATGFLGGGLFIISYSYFFLKSVFLSRIHPLPFIIILHGSVEKLFSGSIKNSILIFSAIGMIYAMGRMRRSMDLK